MSRKAISRYIMWFIVLLILAILLVGLFYFIGTKFIQGILRRGVS
jgi:hypothetical protein